MTTDRADPHLLRHELKHTICQGEDRILSSRLRRLFSHDANAGPDGSYRISSLYFDTPTDTALRQKLDGVNCREKFRLRYYGDDLGFIRLEKKYKINGMCGKRSTRVTEEQVEKLLSGDIGFLLSGDELMQELYSKMKGQLLSPKTIVTYDREAFLFAPGNVRITLDRNVRTGLVSLDFLNPQLHHVPVSDGLTVLEVKYDEFLPEIVKMAVQILPWDYNLAFATYSLGMPDPINDSTLYVNYPINTPASGEVMKKRPLYHNLMKHGEYFAKYHAYFDYLIESYFESGYFEDFVADTTAMIAPYVEKDPIAFCSYEDWQLGVETIRDFCLLRAESVRGQLVGTIPSTIAAQVKDKSTFVDASMIWLPDMGEIADLKDGYH